MVNHVRLKGNAARLKGVAFRSPRISSPAAAERPSMRACGLRQERYSEKRRGEARRLKPVYAAVNVEIVKTDEWEAAIPGDKRKTRHIDEEVFETDDPRWLAFLHALHQLHEAESEAECALADIVPTTMAGVCALLKYGAEVEVHGAWNDLVALHSDYD